MDCNRCPFHIALTTEVKVSSRSDGSESAQSMASFATTTSLEVVLLTLHNVCSANRAFNISGHSLQSYTTVAGASCPCASMATQWTQFRETTRNASTCIVPVQYQVVCGSRRL